MMHTPATYITVVTNPRAHTPLSHRFSRTFGLERVDGIYRLPHPELPYYPVGTSAHSVLYRLGHPDRMLRSQDSLTPSGMRQVRHHAHAGRKGKTIHLFGMVDTDSPYGNRRFLESVLRSLKGANVPIVLHVGAWHPTPQEFTYGLRELQSLCSDTLRVGSVFPVHGTGYTHGVPVFVQRLTTEDKTDSWQTVVYPLTKAYVFHSSLIQPTDQVIIANHQLHGLDQLTDALRETTEEPVIAFSLDLPRHAAIDRALHKSRHIMAISSRPTYTQAYFGEIPHHPYFESLHGDDANSILEMLISPHFGYTAKPYRTVVLLEESQQGNSDWLLASYVKLIRHLPYYVCLVDPTKMDGNVVITNLSINPTASLYEQLHQYA